MKTGDWKLILSHKPVMIHCCESYFFHFDSTCGPFGERKLDALDALLECSECGGSAPAGLEAQYHLARMVKR